LLQLEKKAQELEADEIALQVFGHNYATRALYEKLGYETTNLYMAKPLHSGASM
jgi:ribosomal protein S18 acetylase RimI-like enzyme